MNAGTTEAPVSPSTAKTSSHSGGRASAIGLFALLGVLLLLVGGIVLALVIGSTPAGAPGAHPAGPGKAAAANEKALNEAHAAFVQGEYAKAAALLEPAIKGTPDDQELRLLMAQAQCGLKAYPRAYEEMKAAIAIGPGGAELQFDAGTIANSAGFTEQALEHYSMARQANPREPKYPLYLAMIQIKVGQESAAIASLVGAVKLDPNLAEGWGTLGELELKGNSLGLALDHLRKAKDLQPAKARWRLGEAKVLKRQGKPEEAAVLITALEAKDRFTLDALGALAECFGLMGKPRDAAEQYAAAAAKQPGTKDEAELHFQAADWFNRAGDKDTAAKHARKAKDLGHP